MKIGQNLKIYGIFSFLFNYNRSCLHIPENSEVPERDAAGGYKAPSFDSSNFYRPNMISTRFLFLCFCINLIETARWRSKCRRDICLTVSKSFVWESKFFVKRVNFHSSSWKIKSKTVHPPIFGHFISQKDVHKSSFVHKSGIHKAIHCIFFSRFKFISTF